MLRIFDPWKRHVQCTYLHIHGPVRVPCCLLGPKRSINWLYSRQKAIFVDEFDKDDGLPLLLLAVEVALEILRVVIYDGRRIVHHQPLKRLGQQFPARRRQHSEQLLERKKRFSHFEFEFQPGEVLDVSDPGGVVVRVEPGPRDATVVVIVLVNTKTIEWRN